MHVVSMFLSHTDSLIVTDSEREGEPFTAIVGESLRERFCCRTLVECVSHNISPTLKDGANVAYFGHGKVHYSQVKFVVEELERMNEKPLVLMPQKYTALKFNVNRGSTQELSGRDLNVLKE